jgi:hypothetical protein
MQMLAAGAAYAFCRRSVLGHRFGGAMVRATILNRLRTLLIADKPGQMRVESAF